MEDERWTLNNASPRGRYWQRNRYEGREWEWAEKQRNESTKPETLKATFMYSTCFLFERIYLHNELNGFYLVIFRNEVFIFYSITFAFKPFRPSQILTTERLSALQLHFNFLFYRVITKLQIHTFDDLRFNTNRSLSWTTILAPNQCIISVYPFTLVQISIH